MKIKLVEEDVQETEVIIKYNELNEEVATLIKLLNSNDNRFIATHETGTKFIEASDVLYCEHVDRRVYLYTANEVFSATYTLLEIEEKFEIYGFIRVSKSTIVNINSIESFKSEISGRIVATLTNDEQLIISRHYSRLLRQKLL